MAHHAALVAAFHVPAQERCAASDNSAPRLVLKGGQSLCRAIGLAVATQDIGQAHPVGHAANAARCRATPVATWCR